MLNSTSLVSRILKYPLDRICIKSGVYCPSCQRKIDAGEVSSEDLEVLRVLVELEDKLKFLRKGEYVKTAAISDVAVVFIKNGFEVDERRVLEEELSLHLGKKVKVVEYTNDLKKLVEQLIYPATLYGINRVWIPDGSELLNIRVSKRDRKFLKNKEEYEKLIEKISNAKVKIIFE